MRKKNVNTKSCMITGEVRSKNQTPLNPVKHTKQDELKNLALSVLAGSEYRMINNPELYQQLYRRRILEENCDFDLQPRLSAYGIFDISDIHPPSIEGRRLVFFARNSHNVPYKVTCDLTSRKMRYELLPYESSYPQEMQSK
jgi:hypothetical protein